MSPKSKTHPLQTLNRIFIVLHRSLAMYLADAAPWTAFGHHTARERLNNLVADQRDYARRLSLFLTSRRHTLDQGEFPMTYTDLHDLSLDYLMTELVRHQRQDVLSIERLVGELSGDPEARRLAEEVLGNARGHLELLEEAVAKPEGTAKPQPPASLESPPSPLKSHV